MADASKRSLNHKAVYLGGLLVLAAMMLLVVVPFFSSSRPDPLPPSSEALTLAKTSDCAGRVVDPDSLRGETLLVLVGCDDCEVTPLLKVARELQQRSKKHKPPPAIVVSVAAHESACDAADGLGLSPQRIAIVPAETVANRPTGAATIILVDRNAMVRKTYPLAGIPNVMRDLAWLMHNQ